MIDRPSGCMSHEEFILKSDIFFNSCRAILNEKNVDYSPEGVAYEQVEEVAKETGTTPERVLYIYMKKHLSALSSYVRRGQLESESIDERLRDIANYAALIFVWIEKARSNRH